MKKELRAKGRRDFLKNSVAFGALMSMPFGTATANTASAGAKAVMDRLQKKNGIPERRPFNGEYTDEFLNKVAFPIGGIGAGMFCMEGTGAISHLSVRNHPDVYNEPYAFAAISVKGFENGAKVLEAPVPFWKLFGPGGSGNGSGNRSYGLPRFAGGRFLSRFPFATLELEDPDIPLQVKVVGWSPFIPGDEDHSSLPVGVMEYQFKNTSSKAIEAVFSYNARNFIDEQGKISEEKNGFRLMTADHAASPGSGFSIYVNQDDAIVDHCWFRGAWFDPQTILWKHIKNAELVSNPPVEGVSPGASVYVPLSLKSGEEKVVAVNFSWYLPENRLSSGSVTGAAFRSKPSAGSVGGQFEVSGFSGKQLVNTFDPGGDGQTGMLESPVITINKQYMKFLIGGGNDPEKTAVKLLIDGKVVETAVGQQTEMLTEKILYLKSYQ